MFRWLVNFLVTSFLFFPEEEFILLPKDAGLTAENAVCRTEDGVNLHGWYLPAASDGPTLLYLHGNGGNISGRLFKAKDWIDRGVSVLLIDYRGYGRSEGSIREEGDIYRDTRAAFQWLKEKKGRQARDIILYGESLGSAAATELATHEAFKGLILEAPFASVEEMAKIHYPWVPSGFLKDFRFRTIDRIANIQCPLFIIHGTADEICPYAMGRALFDKAVAEKDFLSVKGGNHNDLPELAGAAFVDKAYEFIKKNSPR